LTKPIQCTPIRLQRDYDNANGLFHYCMLQPYLICHTLAKT